MGSKRRGVELGHLWSRSKEKAWLGGHLPCLHPKPLSKGTEQIQEHPCKAGVCFFLTTHPELHQLESRFLPAREKCASGHQVSSPQNRLSFTYPTKGPVTRQVCFRALYKNQINSNKHHHSPVTAAVPPSFGSSQPISHPWLASLLTSS